MNRSISYQVHLKHVESLTNKQLIGLFRSRIVAKNQIPIQWRRRWFCYFNKMTLLREGFLTRKTFNINFYAKMF